MAKFTKQTDAKNLHLELTSDEFASVLGIALFYRTDVEKVCELLFETGHRSFEYAVMLKLKCRDS